MSLSEKGPLGSPSRKKKMNEWTNERKKESAASLSSIRIQPKKRDQPKSIVINQSVDASIHPSIEKIRKREKKRMCQGRRGTPPAQSPPTVISLLPPPLPRLDAK
mmetsp:Transcript_14958/g.30215  ORF Transcript_14958/g.30215 Transcript_14958/m.30215 type:complete len:105 (+) Transcript_14958:1475-1789(+)